MRLIMWYLHCVKGYTISSITEFTTYHFVNLHHVADDQNNNQDFTFEGYLGWSVTEREHTLLSHYFTQLRSQPEETRHLPVGSLFHLTQSFFHGYSSDTFDTFTKLCFNVGIFILILINLIFVSSILVWITNILVRSFYSASLFLCIFIRCRRFLTSSKSHVLALLPLLHDEQETPGHHGTKSFRPLQQTCVDHLISARRFKRRVSSNPGQGSM